MIQKYNEASIQRFVGLSTDTKPTGCSQGSWSFEMDTNKQYMFDADNTQWHDVTASSSDISAAIAALYVASVGGDGKYISAISETNGKISATAETMDTTPTQNSTKAITSGAVYTVVGDINTVLEGVL